MWIIVLVTKRNCQIDRNQTKFEKKLCLDLKRLIHNWNLIPCLGVKNLLICENKKKMQGQAQPQILQGGSVVLKMTEQPLTSVGKESIKFYYSNYNCTVIRNNIPIILSNKNTLNLSFGVVFGSACQSHFIFFLLLSLDVRPRIDFNFSDH